MNNDIANKIKSSLENYEVPYDASAWDKMSQRLDAKPSGGNGFLSNPKTWVVASITVIGASLAIYKMTDTNNKPLLASKNSRVENAIDSEHKVIEVKENTLTTVSNSSEKSISTQKNKEGNSLSFSEKQVSSLQEVTSESTSLKVSPNNKGNEKNIRSFMFPKTNKSYCLGEKIEISNPNNVDIFLTTATGKQIKIEAQESVLIPLQHEGQYTWNNGDKLAFEVKEKPSVNFSLPSDIIYENGIPTVTLTSQLNVKSQKWMFNQRVVSTSEDVKISIFNKEQYSVTLQVVGQNGCENVTTKTFYPEPSFNYNLKAPTGFEPTSSNPKRNTFLPLSLLERDTPFRMLIIDPKDGSVIFETTDKHIPWDGTNQKTDQLVPEGSEYIWKVILMNPEKYEKNEYKGMITRK